MKLFITLFVVLMTMLWVYQNPKHSLNSINRITKTTTKTQLADTKKALSNTTNKGEISGPTIMLPSTVAYDASNIETLVYQAVLKGPKDEPVLFDSENMTALLGTWNNEFIDADLLFNKLQKHFDRNNP